MFFLVLTAFVTCGVLLMGRELEDFITVIHCYVIMYFTIMSWGRVGYWMRLVSPNDALLLIYFICFTFFAIFVLLTMFTVTD
jgi:hypothetical protein